MSPSALRVLGRMIHLAIFWIAAPIALLFGVGIVVLGIGGALYVGGWLMFVGGIADAINLFKAQGLVSMADVLVTLLKLLGAGPVAAVLGWGSIGVAIAVWSAVDEHRPKAAS